MENTKNIEKEGGAQEGIAPFISWSKDSQGNYTSCNEKFEEFFGVKESDIIGKKNSDFMEGALSALFDELDRAVLKSQKQLFREGQTLSHSGEHVIFEIIKTPLFDYEKKPLGIFSIMRDVTELKRIKKEAEEKEKYSQSLLRISRKMEQAQTYREILLAAKEDVAETIGYKSMWVYLIDEDKRYAHSIVAEGTSSDVIMSEDGTATLSIKGDKMLEEIASAKEIVVVEDARTDPRTNKEIVGKIGIRTIINIPIILFDKNLGSVGLGTYADEGVRVPTLAEQKYLVAIASHMAVSLDRIRLLLERKKTEDSMKKLSHELLVANKNLEEEKISIEKAKAQDEAIMASLGEGMIATNKKGEIVAINHAAEKITGLKTSEVIGELITGLVRVVDFDGKDIPREDQPIFRVIATEKSFSVDVGIIGKEGRITPVSVVASPIVVNNELVGVAVIFRDITKEKEIETTRRDILSLASHQLRTPLSGTKWLIETLQRGVQGELTKGQKEYLNELYKVNERMTTLVQDMLKALRVETDPFLSRVSECSVKKVFENTIETLKLAAEKRQITIHAPKYDDYVIETNPLVLENILHIFVSNGIDYSPSGTDVYMEVEDKDNELVFLVRDSGIGIPKDERARIFERFYRASNAKIFDTTGSGLGLYTANVLAQKIGARISFDSEEGKGSAFYLYVPRK